MERGDLAWTVPVMRAGYAGRGLVYLAVAGFSLYAIWRGGQAEGASSALRQLETTVGGGVVLFLIFLGMLAYALWRLVAALYDLEDRGTGGKGIVARVGMAVTGLIHLSIGFLAFSLLFLGGDGSGGGGSGGGEGSAMSQALGAIMAWPGGRWVVIAVGLVVAGAGFYYIRKGWKGTYRRHLRANRFTTGWNWLLKAGVIAHGVVIVIVGGLFVQAGWRVAPDEAGGADKAFSWLTGQPYGQVLVAAICLGLLGFALFCFVNAAYRVVPRVAGGDVETLAARLQAKARRAARA